ncbi:DUF202 domain-containing protein [Amycolatopsis pigmentata]|uniref:DUF202 domain-containing protein n=1 Tax=Amycolatopsis pigmentata TaxID=450801 RepID=A0ABW5FKW5_9PSEU
MTARDRGLQPERTTLAWQRTGLSAAVVAVLELRSGIGAGSLFDVVAGCCALVVVVLTWVAGRRPGVNRRLLPLTAWATVATAFLVTVRLLWTAK